MSTAVILGTLDTKGAEFKFLKEQIESYGVKTIMIDTSASGDAFFEPDIPSSVVAQRAGKSLEELRMQTGRAVVQETMGVGARAIVADLLAQGKIDAFISMGGDQGLGIASYVMRALPFGFPKIMLSTAVGVENHQELFPACKDLFGANPTTDIAGLNSVLCTVMSNAAAAIAGMANRNKLDLSRFSGKRIGMTMLGVTTPCCMRVSDALSAADYEMLIYHTTGVGGESMERMMREGIIKGVVDITPAEVFHRYILKDSYPVKNDKRLEVAGELGLPQIVTPGGLDLITCFGYSVNNLPEQYKDRVTIPLGNRNAFVLRTNKEENIAIGKLIAEKLNRAKGATAVALPLKGLSKYDTPGQPFWNPETDAALIETLKANLNGNIKTVEVDAHINDPVFADTVSGIALDLFRTITPTDSIFKKVLIGSCHETDCYWKLEDEQNRCRVLRVYPQASR